MTIIVRSTPAAAADKLAVPFKLFVPRELDREPAMAGYEALTTLESAVLADPFIAPGVSSVFPGIVYAEGLTDEQALALVVEAMAPAVDDWPEAYEDAWIELWVPDSFEPKADVLAVDDLTQQPTK